MEDGEKKSLALFLGPFFKRTNSSFFLFFYAAVLWEREEGFYVVICVLEGFLACNKNNCFYCLSIIRLVYQIVVSVHLYLNLAHYIFKYRKIIRMILQNLRISFLILGEDRWLCTLLLQRGYRVEYSAASDAFTHCPEGFNEFYNQRRRWVPSTIANIMDLLVDYKRTVKINDNISVPYIFYQVRI